MSLIHHTRPLNRRETHGFRKSKMTQFRPRPVSDRATMRRRPAVAGAPAPTNPASTPDWGTRGGGERNRVNEANRAAQAETNRQLTQRSAVSSLCCISHALPKCQLSLLGPPTSSLSFFPFFWSWWPQPGCSLPSACPWLPLWDCLPSDNGPIVLFGTFHPVDFPFWYTWVLHQRIHKWVANTLAH